jgi:hypothetical protein
VATHRENFDFWFVEVLETLYPCREAGFVVLMATLPLLERYLRQRTGLVSENDKLTCKFYDELYKVLPELNTRDRAKDFWNIYRNGLLHQVTFSQNNKSKIRGSVSHDPKEIISFDPQTSNFRLHPVLFSKQVLKQIVSDFSMFEGASSAAPPLSTVHKMASGETHTRQVGEGALNTPVILGTSADIVQIPHSFKE